MTRPHTSPRSRMKQSPVLKLAQLRSRSVARMFLRLYQVHRAGASAVLRRLEG